MYDVYEIAPNESEKGIYELRGKIVEEFDFLSMEMIAMRKLQFIHDPRLAEEPRHATMGIREKTDPALT